MLPTMFGNIDEEEDMTPPSPCSEDNSEVAWVSGLPSTSTHPGSPTQSAAAKNTEMGHVLDIK